MGSAYVPRITVNNYLVGQLTIQPGEVTAEEYYGTGPGRLALLKVDGAVYPNGYRLDLPGGGYRNFYVATSLTQYANPAMNPVLDIYLVCYSLSYTQALPQVTFSNMEVYLIANS